MNRGKKPMPERQYKKNRKEVRAAQAAYATPSPEPTTKTITPRSFLKAYPKKIAAKDAQGLASMELSLKNKHQKTLKKRSKRTNTGIPSDSTPEITHIEGARWIKTLTKQSLNQRQRMTKRFSKKK